MRNHSVLFGVAVAVAVASCSASKTFHHPTKTTADFERESYECKVIAEQAHAAGKSESAKGLGILGAPLDALAIQDRVTECLQKKYGWRLIEGK